MSQSSLRIPIVLTPEMLLERRFYGNVSILTEDSDRSNFHPPKWSQRRGALVSILTEDSDRSNASMNGTITLDPPSQSSLRIPIVLTPDQYISTFILCWSQSSLRIPIVLTVIIFAVVDGSLSVSILTEDSDRSNLIRRATYLKKGTESQSSLRIPIVLTCEVGQHSMRS